MLFIAAGAFTCSAMAGPCKKSKPENISKYKTTEMVKFIDSTIYNLNSSQNPNKRHLASLSKCQKILSSSKKQVKGIEAKNLKLCMALKNKGIYNTTKVALKVPSDEIKFSDQKQPRNIIKNQSIAIKKDTKVTTNKSVEKENSLSKKNSGLLLF